MSVRNNVCIYVCKNVCVEVLKCENIVGELVWMSVSVRILFKSCLLSIILICICGMCVFFTSVHVISVLSSSCQLLPSTSLLHCFFCLFIKWYNRYIKYLVFSFMFLWFCKLLYVLSTCMYVCIYAYDY